MSGSPRRHIVLIEDTVHDEQQCMLRALSSTRAGLMLGCGTAFNDKNVERRLMCAVLAGLRAMQISLFVFGAGRKKNRIAEVCVHRAYLKPGACLNWPQV